MSLTPGKRLGPYEIIAPLGAGGMGEVYRARDTRLDRLVAVKIIQSHLAGNSEGRARFEREARAISSLNHPHICVLHDIGREDDTDFLVMEYLDGETLAARLERGPLPTGELLAIAMQMADALDRAHRHGVVHRDLKPGNVMLTAGGAKLLDFGLARQVEQASPVAALTMSPTVSRPITTKGTLVGTFHYMAPELLEGREASTCSDVFAFGAIVYEMATGRRAFDGKSYASVIAAVLEKDPEPITAIQPVAPPALDRLVRDCLAKNPEMRRHSMHDVLLELRRIADEGPSSGAAQSVPARRPSGAMQLLPWALGLLVAAAAFGVGRVAFNPPRPATLRFSIPGPSGAALLSDPRVSPDGRIVAYSMRDSTGVNRIWVQPLDALEGRVLEGTEGATRPFWSPDSRFLAFFQEGKLRKVTATGGPVQTLADTGSRGDGSWSPEGTILFDATTSDSLRAVSASGGIPAPIVTVDRARGETGNAWPQFLPDGRHFLFLGVTPRPEETALKVGTLGSNEVKTLMIGNCSRVEYAHPGYLLFVRDRALVAQPFDADALRLSGEPFPIVDDVSSGGLNLDGGFSVSRNGVLVYCSAGAGELYRLVWMERNGTVMDQVGSAAEYESVVLSPDEKRVAVSISENSGSSDVWLIDRARSVPTRLTFDASHDFWPIWSHDGSSIIFSSELDAEPAVFQKPATGMGDEKRLFVGKTPVFASDCSPDGRFIAVEIWSDSNRWDVAMMPFDGGEPVPFLKSQFSERHPRFSPDGRWLAYVSNESGRTEVYVQAFPGPGGKWRVSTDGGLDPQWRHDGRELYFLALNGKMMAADVNAGTDFEVTVPQVLFDATVPAVEPFGHYFSVARDGRFLVGRPLRTASVTPTTVVLNWAADL